MTRTILIAGATLMMAGPAAAQPERFSSDFVITTGPAVPTGRSALSVRERLLSFDANKDLRISRDELPDRMQALIAHGDKNADGALDIAEIQTLINAAASERTRVFVRPQPSEGLQGVISDLKLSPAKREQALVILGAHRPHPDVKGARNTDLYKAMRSLLDDEEYENFVAAAERLSRTAPIRMGTIN